MREDGLSDRRNEVPDVMVPIRTFSLLAQTDMPKKRRLWRTISRGVVPAGSFASSATDRSRISGAFARSAWRKARRTPSASRLVQ